MSKDAELTAKEHPSSMMEDFGRFLDVAIDPRAPEGIWLRRYLRSRKIPYYAFTSAVARKATGAHIHIGPASNRLQRPVSKA